MNAIAAEVITRRNLVKQLAIRDLKLRYERSVLGFFWSLLNPLIMIGVYTFFFSHVIRMGVERFPIFLVSVLLPWNFLTRGLLNTAPLIYQNGYLLNRASFPPESLIFGGLLSAFAEFVLEMLILTVILVIIGSPLLPGLAVLPVAMLILLMFTTGISLIFAVAFVYYRDTQYILSILTTVWMYMTPVFYPVTSVPAQFQMLYNLNPMVHIAAIFRGAVYNGHLPQWNELALSMGIACITFAAGWAFFSKYKWEFAEVI